jgi:RNA polymerase sigma factor (TIGR02999 family)
VSEQTHETNPTQVTELLGEIQAGDRQATDKLAELVYHELRGLAGAIMRGGEAGHTLQPTALLHEAWLKLVGHLGSVNDRPHFFAVAAKAMRQVLTDHVKAQRRLKRGGGVRRITFSEGNLAEQTTDFDMVAFHDSLERLASLNERQARVIELRLLGALSIEEAASILGVSDRTVKTDWMMAKAWLMRELSGE